MYCTVQYIYESDIANTLPALSQLNAQGTIAAA
jgi:hypothetical protein